MKFNISKRFQFLFGGLFVAIVGFLAPNRLENGLKTLIDKLYTELEKRKSAEVLK